MTQTRPENVDAYNRRMAGKRFLGGLLMAVGGMVALLCGLCTLAFGVTTIMSAVATNNVAGLWVLIVPLLLGGLPAAGGVAVFMVGLKKFREGLKRQGVSASVFD